MNGQVVGIPDLSLQPVSNLPDTPSRIRLFNKVLLLQLAGAGYNCWKFGITSNGIAITYPTIETVIPKGATKRGVSII